MGIYVYAISRAGDDAVPPLQGILDQPVYQLAFGPVTAFVSDCTLESVRAERKHIAASQRVLRVLTRSSICCRWRSAQSLSRRMHCRAF